MSAKICIVVPTATLVKGRPEGIRRNFYFALERYAYRTPFGWIMDYEVCADLLNARLGKMNEEYRSLTGVSLFQVMVASVDEHQLRQLLSMREREPESPVGRKLEERLRKKEIVVTT